jgi:hypothetical protein
MLSSTWSATHEAIRALRLLSRASPFSLVILPAVELPGAFDVTFLVELAIAAKTPELG